MSDKQIGRVAVSQSGGPIHLRTSVPGASPSGQRAEPAPHAVRGTPATYGPAHHQEQVVQRGGPVDAVAPDKALEVLTLAQRTAEAHVAGAAGQARKALADAEARIEQMLRDAQSHADQIRGEAEAVLAEAHAAAAVTGREAQAEAAEVRRQAEKMLADARAEAQKTVAGGQEYAEQLKLQAQQRYEDAVGGLATKREALQKQIETLEVFNADYRHRLTSFVQSQMRALWTEQPDVPGAVVSEVGRHPISSGTG
ncbi:hypothetical protein [Actinoplanes sp. M2I2]|uniref:hypothetical protein n=1 Tax=Actinoplanes sp. M2I2 TaxID=1734444 RepID=UPI0020216C97|nr:hypothetical protein [Actinoplanes sp. M2I2]